MLRFSFQKGFCPLFFNNWLKGFSILFLLPLLATAQLENLLPLPKQSEKENGFFPLSKSTIIVCQDSGLKKDIAWFNACLQKRTGYQLPVQGSIPKAGNYIYFSYPDFEAGFKEHYHLKISQNKIEITAENQGSGFFYGLNTLVQLVPLKSSAELKASKSSKISLPCVSINDAPRFRWRGLHLDVCRHFSDVDFIKRYLDLMALYKFNTFHWHLTDDQGWRIEIKRYPKLTEIGSQRKGSMAGPYSDQRFDSIPYGGFYTQEQIKDIVRYAEERHITIVPEIEMPGHSSAAIAAYPWLSCRKRPIEVAKGWGVFEDVLCTNDSVFEFMQNVLTEVMALFPSTFIHIGGDECPKTRWQECPICQQRIKSEGLKDEHELQSYFVKRIEKFVNSKGRQIIGWDEILEGGLAPNAAVMSWRGTEGGIAAAKSRHYAVMSPGSHCYFDHYQGTPADEPLAIGGFTPIDKVYTFEPVPEKLNEQEAAFILGAQANVWTEYMYSTKQIEYMVWPRACALSEVLWSPKEKRNISSFFPRLESQLPWLDAWQVNYSNSMYRVNQQSILTDSGLAVSLISSVPGIPVYYALGKDLFGTKPILYTKPIPLTNNTAIQAGLFKQGKLTGTISKRAYVLSKATRAKVSVWPHPSPYYNTGGAFTLVNGVKAGVPRVNEEWLGWSGQDVEVTLDLTKMQPVKRIEMGFLNEELNWIYLPKQINMAYSSDGVNFSELKQIDEEEIRKMKRQVVAEFPIQHMRFVKISVKHFGKIPSGKPGAGENAWLFMDEIVID